MSPAREVGGDFYDFFMVDDDHLAILIADVSDKGVGSAFFMAISKTLVKTYAKMVMNPTDVIAKVDRQISEKNEAGLFVTLWMAVIDLNTGHVNACNAGHDYPAIMKNGEDFVVEKTPHGPPVAFIPGMEFLGMEFDMKPGDRIFLYTDGLNEAKRSDDERFGTDRMLEVLNAHKDVDNETMIHLMREAVDEFAGDEPQFDDMTMLGFTFKGRG
jgi:serine phosphatase RsbU (regulator of sigma subunit)